MHDGRGIDGDLLVVGAQAVAVCVGVGEEATLQHLVRRRLDACGPPSG